MSLSAKPRERMGFLSVCSGIEAASVAWRPLGWEAVGFAEIEAFPSAVLAHHYPDVPNLGDITKFKDWPDAAFDILVGGTPCQSFSVAGLRKGLADPRGNLALTYLGIADRYRPEWIIWENVPGVLSLDDGRAFGSIIGGLAELRYGWAYRVLDAQYIRVDGFGRAVPQRRRRVFVVGNSRDWRRAAAVLFEPESLSGDPPPSREARQAVASGLGAGSKRSGGRLGRREAAGNQLIPSTGDTAHCLNAVGMGRQDYETETVIAHALRAKHNLALREDVDTLVAHALRADGFDASEDGTGRGTPLVAEVADTITAHWERSNGAKAGNQVGMTNPIIEQTAFSITPSNSNKDYNAREVEKAQAITGNGNRPSARGGDLVAGPLRSHVRNNSNPATEAAMHILDGWAVRRLTPTECERLMGFPDGYTAITHRGKPATDGPRYKALGNSIAVNVLRWLGRRIELVNETVAEFERPAA